MKLFAAFCFRYEPDWMIDQLLENISWMDGHVSLNNRDATELWVPDEQRIPRLHELARKAGADWNLVIDPDERLEDNCEVRIRSAIETGARNIRYQFPFRELWTPDSYRVDGIWGRKKRRRLAHIEDFPVRKRMTLDVNLYHLKMIEPANRTLRKNVFKEANYWDNKRIGFDYLDDETGCQLEQIPEGRGYSPAYQKWDFQVEGFQQC